MQHRNKRNPILPLDIYIPDSEAHPMPDGRLYLYGSFDETDAYYCSDKYHVVSTGDMENWQIHDTAFTGQAVPWYNDPNAPKYFGGMDWTKPTPFMEAMLQAEKKGEGGKVPEPTENPDIPPLLYAPDAAEKNGAYYLYFCMGDDSEGVAKSARPEGPYTDPVRLPCAGIDPAVFTDTDGKSYYYWGQIRAHGAQLGEDMASFVPGTETHDLVSEAEHFFHEGASMRKIGDTYYFIFSDMSRGKPTSLGYATGASPLGPFTYRGVIVDNDGADPKNWNNHGSIACFNGQWYVFYQRSSRNSKLFRRLCIEKLTVAPDGSIPEVKMTSQGIGDPFGPGETIYGYQTCGLKGSAYIDKDPEWEEKLTAIQPGDSALFRYVRKDTPWEKVSLTCKGTGTVRVEIGGVTAGTVAVTGPVTTAEISAPAGTSELILHFEASQDLELGSVTLY